MSIAAEDIGHEFIDALDAIHPGYATDIDRGFRREVAESFRAAARAL